MREIKFRTWDGVKIRKDFTLHSDGQVIIDKSVHAIGFHPILMQYIGIKDCNDVDIFEGDILRVTSTEDMDVSFLHTVKHSKSGYLIDIVHPMSDYDRMDMHGAQEDICYYEYEVIGNIYEHSKLSSI